jgi:hypothetical protein
MARSVLERLPLEELARRLSPFLPADTPDVVLTALAEAARGAAALADVADSALAVAQTPQGSPPASPALQLFSELREPDLREHLPYEAAVALIDGLRALGQSRGLAPRDVLHPLRVALTGSARGLPLPVVAAVLTREQSLERCRT